MVLKDASQNFPVLAFRVDEIEEFRAPEHVEGDGRVDDALAGV